MAINIKPVSELLDLEFVIPNYQRGYRWDNEQVTALLEDLRTFQKDANANDFYCLQPVVVVADKKDNRKFIVVDGQQRLTTLLLILKCLEGKDTKCFNLKMDKRKEQEKYIAEGTYATDDEDYSRNIDNFYVRKAFETITQWKNDNPNEDKLSTLLIPNPKKGYVAVIWYEIPEEDALAAFRRLNYGKIPLTDAELVKALLMQTDCYTQAEREIQQVYSQRRAMEWDEMEHRLSNPLFASMVCRRDEKLIEKGMDTVLDFVADKINLLLKRPMSRKKDVAKERDHFVYNVIDSRIKEALASGMSRQEIVDEIWREVQETFNRLADWFENREWYHLIGLWRLMSRQEGRKFMADIIKMSVDTEGNPVSKLKFTERIKRHIGDSYIRVPLATQEVEIPDSDGRKRKEPLPDDMQGLNSPELQYEGREKKKLINILTALNVIVTHEDPNGTARFPFHLFQRFNPTSLEHIHPQNITTDIKYDEAKRWVGDRVTDSREADDTVWLRFARSSEIKISAEFESADAAEKDRILIQKARIKVDESISELEKLLVSEDSFNENNDAVHSHLRILDRLFGDMAGIEPDDLHSISNMALVSKRINSALSNLHLDSKRKILIERDSLSKSDENATYVPICTHMVFAKIFRPESPGNMKFWQPEDRAAYKEKIRKVYEDFTN